MDLTLDDHALRVLGALMEKSLATPDYYPMSLSALVAACNQKTAREPVMSLSEGQVSDALDALQRIHMVRERGTAGARVSKYAHRLDDELGLSYGFDRPQLAVLALLMLRGPQTPGELRNRSGRLHDFGDVSDVEQVLNGLVSARKGPYVHRLAREPGRREARYAQAFSGATQTVDTVEPIDNPLLHTGDTAPPPHGDSLVDRVEALEEQVRQLVEEMARLRRRDD